MQALSLAKECYVMKLDLLSSATVVDRAVQFVERNKGLLEQCIRSMHLSQKVITETGRTITE